MPDTERFLGTARRWRPARFADIVGQEHVSDTLRNAIAHHRVASAYIFAGPRGIGKTTCARILAKALNCLTPVDSEPCNTCEECKAVNEGTSLDIIEIDGASNNSVDDVRKLRDQARYPPVRGKVKMYIIDEVHMLSTSAFNALLKTLEEPPAYLIFVFATTEIQKVPATILSRCQRFDFRRMQVEQIVSRLRHIADAEKVTIDDDALLFIARKAEGAMRDALSIFDQVRAFSGDTIAGAQVRETLNIISDDVFFEAGELIRAHNRAGVFPFVRSLIDRGIDLTEFAAGLAEFYRNILYVAATNDATTIEATAHVQQRYRDAAAGLTELDAMHLLNEALTLQQEVRYAPQPRVHLEFALMKMASLDAAVDLATVVASLGSGSTGSAPAPAAPAPARKASPSASSSPSPGSSSSAPPPASIREAPAEPRVAVAPHVGGDAQSRWQDVVALAKEKRVKCWSSLEHNTVLLGVEGTMVRLACSDSFSLELCRTNQSTVATMVKEIFGAGYTVEFDDAFAAASPRAGAPAPRRTDDDPAVQMLMRELGAREIN